jgi:hypothetical protein
MPDENQEKQPSDLLDAVKELTTAITDLAGRISKLEDEWSRFRKAGKF